MWANNVIKCIIKQSKGIKFNSTTRRFAQSSVLLNEEKKDVELDLLFDMGKEDYKTEAKIKEFTKSKFYGSPTHLVKNNTRDFGEKFKSKDGENFKAKDIKEGRQRRKKTQNRTENDDKTEESPAENEVKADEKKQNVIKKPKLGGLEKYKQHDQELDLWFYKLPFEHPTLNNLIMMSRSKTFRERKHLLVIEGRRLMDDVLDAGLKMEYLFFSKREQLEQIHKKLIACKAKPKICRVPHDELSFWSVLQTCPGMIGVFKKPVDMEPIWNRFKQPETETSKDESNIDQVVQSTQPKITIICDQIREPNNVGSLIRTCAALPCTEIVLLKGCADPWETKALRGGAGAQFRIPIRGPMTWESVRSFLADDNQYTVFIADNKDGHGSQVDFNVKKGNSYSDVPYNRCKHIVLIIGGETEGVSREAYEFMRSKQRLQLKTADETEAKSDPTPESEVVPEHQCLRIPLASGVESLNLNAATAILLFEIRKKLQG